MSDTQQNDIEDLIVYKIPVDLIDFNDYNPNVVAPKKMELLKKTIQREGFKQPITIRKSPIDTSRYIVIDGAHRLTAVREIGYKHIWCIIEDVAKEEMAKVETINMNNLRGEFDSIKLAEVIVSLRKEYSDVEIEDLLGYTQEEIKGYEDLISFDFNKYSEDAEKLQNENPATLSEDAMTMLNDFILPVTLTQLEVIEAAIECTGMKDRAEALTEVCRLFVQKVSPEKLDEIAARSLKLSKQQESGELVDLEEVESSINNTEKDNKVNKLEDSDLA